MCLKKKKNYANQPGLELLRVVPLVEDELVLGHVPDLGDHLLRAGVDVVDE